MPANQAAPRPAASLDLALIGNCTVSALIERRGSIVWCCMPCFDSTPVFDALLHSRDGLPLDGALTVELEGLARTEQSYDPGTAIVRTRLWDDRGQGIELTDFAPRFIHRDRVFRPAQLVRRVHLLAGVNTSGGTNYVATGLAWRFNISERFYVQPGIGVAVHDGRVTLPSPDEPGLTPEERLKRQGDFDTKLDLGSRVLFEPELSIGWKATRRLSVELSWIHISHAKLAGDYNPGLGDVGVRLLYRYGLDR